MSKTGVLIQSIDRFFGGLAEKFHVSLFQKPVGESQSDLESFLEIQYDTWPELDHIDICVEDVSAADSDVGAAILASMKDPGKVANDAAAIGES